MKALKGMMVVGMMMVAGSAMAQSTDVTVSADVTSVCSIIAGNLDFLDYDATDVADDLASSTVTLTCSAGATPTDVSITGYSGMTSATAPGNTLNYSVVIDNTAAADTTGRATNDGDVFTWSLDGTIPAGQFVAAASDYQDTITLSIVF